MNGIVPKISLALAVWLSWMEQSASWAPPPGTSTSTTRRGTIFGVMIAAPQATRRDNRDSITLVCSDRAGRSRHTTTQLKSLFEYYDEDEFGSPATEDDDEDELSDDELLSSAGDFDERIPRLNTVHLTGRVGNDPEPRYFDDGKVVVNLNLACRRKYHWEDREANEIAWGEEETDWYSLEIWSGLAEFVSKFVDKGARVGVIGALQEDEYTDRETGERRSRVKIIVRDLDVLETKAEADLRRSNKGRSGGQSFYNSGKQQNDAKWPSQAGGGDFF